MDITKLGYNILRSCVFYCVDGSGSVASTEAGTYVGIQYGGEGRNFRGGGYKFKRNIKGISKL